ncbi:MAG: serine/threonine protein kinase [Gammaproteobacteria bacterium]|jgi:Ser/Thr protein kinase RdoA (MazF antagonist)
MSAEVAPAPYASLLPETVIQCVEQAGFVCNGSIHPLNSYENRVYQIGLDDGFVIAKFYRPQRWSDAAILEEHDFSLELAAAEIPVVAPIVVDGSTLLQHSGFRFAVFPRRGGHWPELSTRDERLWMGRFIGRIHAIGAARAFRHRERLSIERFGDDSVEVLLSQHWLPDHLLAGYEAIVDELLGEIERIFDESGAWREIRIHGDCHPGNVLWTDDGPHFVDLDDCMSGPAVQDLWLFLSGSHDEMSGQLADLLEGYSQFHDFDYRELRLIEALRSLRIIHYTAWIARRWSDPAFPRAFPWFTENKYWEEHVLTLREQRAALDDPLHIRA